MKRGTDDAGKWNMTGVKSPMKTKTKTKKRWRTQEKMDIQLFNQFEAVDSATPLLLIDNGITSLGKTQAIGPREAPYTPVNVYIPLYT